MEAKKTKDILNLLRLSSLSPGINVRRTILDFKQKLMDFEVSDITYDRARYLDISVVVQVSEDKVFLHSLLA